MKKTIILLLAAIFLLTVPTAVLAADDGGYIVVIKEDVEITPLFEQTYQLTQLTVKDHGVYETDAANAARLEENALVESACEASVRTLMVTANDPYYANNTQWALNAVNATAGWDITTGSNSVTVVVIDTGFDTTHADKGNVVGGKDYITGATTTYDHFTHGTACAGLIGAATNNSLGIAGACWNVNVIMLSVFSANADTGKEEASDADIISAIYNAVDVYHADVISMSFGGTSVDDTMKDAVKYANSKNTILVAAAGNSGDKGSPLEYPAAYDEVIGVAASTSSQAIAGFSSKNDSVDITAPGSGIFSLSNQSYNGNSYAYFSGTSLATPYVAALAALAKSVDGDITPTEFKYYLRTTSTDMGSEGYDITSGYGLINYGALLTAVKADQTNTLAGSGSTSDPYLIANEEDLNQFSAKVAAGESAAAARVTADFNVTGFTGINTAYQGVFDGNAHTISGVKGDFFDEIGSNGTVKNLSVNAVINNERYNGIIATVNRGTITNCMTAGSITSDVAGGICGYNYGTISKCGNTATINGDYAGGICARVIGSTISYCYNTAAVSSTEEAAGGICATAQNGAVISNCYNTGVIGNTTATRGVYGRQSASTILNCYYEAGAVTDGISTKAVCRITAAKMKHVGFVSMLNAGNGVFDIDSTNVNNGFPVLRASGLTKVFNDVANTTWYAVPIYDLASDNIVSGKQPSLYFPEDPVTRGEFVLILSHVAKADLTPYKASSSYSDVADGVWYTAAINWATEKKLAYGKSATQFCPNDMVTREEISAFLVRYLTGFGTKPLPAEAALTFGDAGQISAFAKKDTAILTALAVINGYEDNTFRPKNSASRGEAAQMVNRMRTEL